MRPKMDIHERDIALAKLQAASLQQDIAERDYNIEQRSDSVIRQSATASMFHPPGRNIYNVNPMTSAAATGPHVSMQDTPVSFYHTQPAPLDVSTEPRSSAIGPVRTPHSAQRRFEPFVPVDRYARRMDQRLQAAYRTIQHTPTRGGINAQSDISASAPARVEHPEAGSSRIVDTRQEREREVVPDRHRSEIIRDAQAPQDVSRVLSLAQANMQRPVADGETHIIYLNPEQAQAVQTAMERHRSSGEIEVTLPGHLVTTPLEAPGTSAAPNNSILNILAIRTLLVRSLIKAAIGRVPKDDGTYDLSDANIDKQLVLIAKTGGEWTSNNTFIKPVATTDMDVLDSWGTAGGMALSQLEQERAQSEGNGA